MKATFIELPAFQRLRERYLDDSAFKNLQQTLMANPEAGELIQGTGGLRKVRYTDARRGKGKRGEQFWLFTVDDKDEADDLSSDQRKALRVRLEAEIKARSAGS